MSFNSTARVHDRIISDVWLILDIFPRSRFVLTLPDFLKLWSFVELLKNWFETTHNKNLSELQHSIKSLYCRAAALYKLNAVRNKWTFVEKEARHGYSSSAHWKWRVNQYLISFWNTKGSKNSDSVPKKDRIQSCCYKMSEKSMPKTSKWNKIFHVHLSCFEH